ncbi:hypothetical protein EDD99_1740 [Streptomyces sp. 846.5]|nr:hypothetical protein [Streptomyces sp. 846.5]TDU03319.1 hypothetical protein EDD99_1740 [Streptomyces sp. 846.5]
MPLSHSPVPPQPYRWDLLRPDRLGVLLDGVPMPSLWYLDELTDCAAKVVARSGDADLRFVGRSADSVFDLLGGALDGTSWQGRLERLPLSCTRDPADLSPRDLRRLREHLAAAGLGPRALARRQRPVALVDLVWMGRTFTTLHTVIRDWVEEVREPWSAVRLKLRYLGVTSRKRTSPNTCRWHQHLSWTRDLPAAGVSSISLDGSVWHLLGNVQHKTADSFPPARWHLDDDNLRQEQDSGQRSVLAAQRGAHNRAALAEARALVSAGRSAEVRTGLVRRMAAEPAFRASWLRSLARELRGLPPASSRRRL